MSGLQNKQQRTTAKKFCYDTSFYRASSLCHMQADAIMFMLRYVKMPQSSCFCYVVEAPCGGIMLENVSLGRLSNVHRDIGNF